MYFNLFEIYNFLIINVLYLEVGIATGCGLDGRGSIPGTAKEFSVSHYIQTSSEAYPASYTIGGSGS
jgi:hypothetical protein